MRVCHISTVHPVGDARIVYRMCSPLAERGFSVVMIARGKAPVDESLVQMSRWNERIAKAGRLKRIGLALQAALTENADIYHFHDIELIPMALALKILRPGRAVVYDVHEDYPAFMKEKHWLPKSFRPFASWAVRCANFTTGLCVDGIVTADPGVQKDFQRCARRKTMVYYNFPLLSMFKCGAAAESQVKTDLVYVGGMSDRAGTFVLLDALSLLAKEGSRPSVRLAGYTDGEEGRRAVQRGIESRGLQAQVEFRGWIPYSEVPAWIRSGRIGLVTLQAIPKFMKNIPSKMFEYWACGRPVIASNLPPIRSFLSEGKNGLLFDPSSPSALAHAIRSLLQKPQELEAMGQHGQQMIFNRWNNDQQIDGLVRFYNQIRNGNVRDGSSADRLRR
jgi:glycosyltransferase involved in cell wall biosynthesis